MITLGLITDKLFVNDDNSMLFYLGKSSGQSNTEFDVNEKQFFFDENNITKAADVTDDNNLKPTQAKSFINDARFYTCKKQNQDSLCLRCVENCVTCVDCYKCHHCVNCDNCHNYIR